LIPGRPEKEINGNHRPSLRASQGIAAEMRSLEPELPGAIVIFIADRRQDPA